jgi:ribosomal protein L25 (general stress protein Ctc)
LRKTPHTELQIQWKLAKLRQLKREGKKMAAIPGKKETKLSFEATETECIYQLPQERTCSAMAATHDDDDEADEALAAAKECHLCIAAAIRAVSRIRARHFHSGIFQPQSVISSFLFLLSGIFSAIPPFASFTLQSQPRSR